MRRRGRVDGPQRAIVQALRQAGASVVSLADLGGGIPDLLVSVGPTWMGLVEVKNGALSPSRRQLTPDQVRWREQWRGPQPYTVLSVDDALLLVGIARKGAGNAL